MLSVVGTDCHIWEHPAVVSVMSRKTETNMEIKKMEKTCVLSDFTFSSIYVVFEEIEQSYVKNLKFYVPGKLLSITTTRVVSCTFASLSCHFNSIFFAYCALCWLFSMLLKQRRDKMRLKTLNCWEPKCNTVESYR